MNEPVKPGDDLEIRADEWNALRKMLAGQTYESNRSPLDATHSGNRQIFVYNNTVEPVPAFGVMRLYQKLYEDMSIANQYDNARITGIEIRGDRPTEDTNEMICIVQEDIGSGDIGKAIVTGVSCAIVDVLNTEHQYAKPIPDRTDMLESCESGSIRMLVPTYSEGIQVCYVMLGFPNTSEPAINAKELFPVVIYQSSSPSHQSPLSQTSLICPGGKGQSSSTKTVHVLDIENKKISTTKYGSLPVAMNNFDAVIADNGYGLPVLVCAPGDIDEGSRYPVQRYDFTGEEWSKSDTNQSLAGCPAYEKDGKVIVAGGQSAYYVSNPIQQAAGTYGHTTSPFWSIDPKSGALETRVPRRIIVSGFSATPENAVVNQQKRWLKQNFSGIHFERKTVGKGVEFIAVGGTELLGYQSNAVVSYSMDSLGAILDCEHADVHIGGEGEVFPDTPVVFGECDAVRITRRRSGEMMVDCNLLVCFGGRYRVEIDVLDFDQNGNVKKDENGNNIILYKAGEYRPHQKPYYLDLDDKAKGWRNDLFQEVPTPRWNAALSDVVTTTELVLGEDGKPEADAEGKPTNRTQEISRVFLIGGRIDNRSTERIDVKNENGIITKTYYQLVTKKGLTAKIEALNLSTGKWETDFPGLDGKLSH